MWNFINKHDKTLSLLLSPGIIVANKAKLAPHLLASLIAKISKKIPNFQETRKLSCVLRLQNILKLQALNCSHSKFRVCLVKSALLHLHHCTQNAGLDGVKNLDPLSCQIVLRPVLANFELGSPDDDISVGIIFKVVENTAKEFVAKGINNLDEWKKKNYLSIVEMGLSLAFFHTRLFLDDSYSCCEKYRDDIKKFHNDFSMVIENDLAKLITDLIKVILSL